MLLDEYVTYLGDEFVVVRDGTIDALAAELTGYFVRKFRDWIGSGYQGYSVTVHRPDNQGRDDPVTGSDSSPGR